MLVRSDILKNLSEKGIGISNTIGCARRVSQVKSKDKILIHVTFGKSLNAQLWLTGTFWNRRQFI